MQDEKVLTIPPFSHFFFKNCFYNALFPAVAFYKKSIEPFLANELIYYYYDRTSNDNDKFVDIVSEPNKTLDVLLHNQYLEMRTQDYAKDLIHDLTAAVDLGRPILITVDSFYESVRNDCFMQKHLPHSLLVFGYTQAANQFYVFEHRHRDSLQYKPVLLNKDELRRAYEGYQLNFSHFKDPPYSYYEFYPQGSDDMAQSQVTDTQYWTAQYANNILAGKNKITKGMKQFTIFVEDFAQLTEGDSFDIVLMQRILDRLSDIINVKTANKYLIDRLGSSCKDLPSRLGAIVGDWNSIRSIVAKYLYSSEYKPEYKKKLGDGLTRILVQEYEYVDLLFDVLAHEKFV